MTRIADALDRITRLAFDTPPVIYLIEQHPAYHALVRAIFRQISAGTVLGITSIVTLVEVLRGRLESLCWRQSLEHEMNAGGIDPRLAAFG